MMAGVIVARLGTRIFHSSDGQGRPSLPSIDSLREILRLTRRFALPAISSGRARSLVVF